MTVDQGNTPEPVSNDAGDLDPETVRVDVYSNAMPRQWEQEKTVRVTHMPTGLTVSVTGISTHRAKQEALAQLESRLRAADPN